MDNSLNTESDLIKKGYSRDAIKEISRWGLINTSKKEIHIPDLKAKKRIGVVKKLSVGAERGYCSDLVVILKPFPSYRKKIDFRNVDKIDSLLQIEHSLGNSDETKKSNSDIIKSFVKLSVSTSKWEEWKWDVLVLSTDSSIGHLSGKSAGSALYLSLFSAYLEKPIPYELAITGVVNEKSWQIEAIGGLKEKLTAATEKGATNFIIPQENKSDYGWDVPSYVKNKISKVLFAKNVTNLNSFLSENYVCYKCNGKFLDVKFYIENEKDKLFCSKLCRQRHFINNCSNCQKLVNPIEETYCPSSNDGNIFCSLECRNKFENKNINRKQEVKDKLLVVYLSVIGFMFLSLLFFFGGIYWLVKRQQEKVKEEENNLNSKEFSNKNKKAS